MQDPAVGIHAGIKYLAWLRENFTGDIGQTEQTWFTLAACNAGYGHVLDARRLAAELKLDPDRWFGNVEQAMSLLSKPKYYKRTRYWICARWATGHLRSRNKATLCRLCTRSGAIICSHPTMFL
ncbi:MAG: transglycosylase SLT domain-containing protein [Acidiferrobacterales bacterium]|nr:transglycosylase SLT domain-containing protein [Pseudomonadota bacterium]